MNKLSKIVVLSSAIFGILGNNNGYSNPQDEIKCSDNNEILKKEYEEKIFIENKQIGNVLNSLHVIVNEWSDYLQEKLYDLINQNNEFIKSILNYKDEDGDEIKEVNYINISSKLKEYNEQFIEDLNSLEEEIKQYRSDDNFTQKLFNIYNRKSVNSEWNTSTSYKRSLIYNLISEIANKFEEYAATFDYLLNNKQNINDIRKHSMDDFISELTGKFGDYASNLLSNIQTDLSSKDESYGDKLNNILQYLNRPCFITNEPIQAIINYKENPNDKKEGVNKIQILINKMTEINNKIQNQFTRKNIENQLRKACTPGVLIKGGDVRAQMEVIEQAKFV